MQDHQDPHGRARLRNTIDAGKEPRYLWLLPVALLTLGLGGYTQLDKIRALLKPAPTVEAPPTPAPIVSVPTPAIAAPAPTQQARRVEPPPEPLRAPTSPPRRTDNPSALLGAEASPRAATAPAAPPPAPARRTDQAGLVEALRNGEIRPGTAGDIGRWKSSYARATGRGLGRSFDERTAFMEVYVVQKAFEIPDNLSGANAVVFVVETRTPFPSGDPGHSPILDTASGACVGMICRMLLSEE